MKGAPQRARPTTGARATALGEVNAAIDGALAGETPEIVATNRTGINDLYPVDLYVPPGRRHLPGPPAGDAVMPYGDDPRAPV
jgi:hypothetical protein